jgi:hypothetical protein
LWTVISRLLFFNGDAAAAEALALQALALAHRLGDQAGEVDALLALGTSRAGGTALAQARLAQGAALAETAGLWPAAALAHQNLGSILWEQGHLAAAATHYAEAAELCRRCGMSFRYFHASVCAVGLALQQGDLAAVITALPLLQRLAESCAEHILVPLDLANLEGALAGYQGDLGRATALLGEVLARCVRAGIHQVSLVTARTLSRLLLEAEDWPAAQKVLTPIVPLTDRKIFFDRAWARARLSEVAAATGDRAAAARWLAEAEACGADPPSLLETEALALARARLAVAEGRRAAALLAYAEAAAVQAEIGARRDRALTLRAWAAVQAAGETPADHAAARDLLDEAQALFAAMDLPLAGAPLAVPGAAPL